MSNQQENAESTYSDIQDAGHVIDETGHTAKSAGKTAKKAHDFLSNNASGEKSTGNAPGAGANHSEDTGSKEPVRNSDNAPDASGSSTGAASDTAGPAAGSSTGSTAGSTAGGTAGATTGGTAGASAGGTTGTAAGSMTGGAVGGVTGGTVGMLGGPAGAGAGAEAGASTGSSAGAAAGGTAGSTAGGAAGSTAGGAAGSTAGGAAGSTADSLKPGYKPFMNGNNPENNSSTKDSSASEPIKDTLKGAKNSLDKTSEAAGAALPGGKGAFALICGPIILVTFIIVVMFAIAAGARGNQNKNGNGSLTGNGAVNAVMEGDYTTDLLSQYGLTAMTYFLPYESGEEAYNSAGSDSGHAFGAYQFDNRSELGAFLTYCYQTDSSKYGAFEPYCGMDAESLCGNAGLIDAWHNVYAAHTDDFKKMQDSFAWTADATVNPKSMANVIAVQRDRGFDLMQCDAAVRGFVYSIQNRCGWEEYLSHSLCAKAGVTNAMSDIEIINALEDTIRHFDFSSSGEFAQPYTIPERYVTGGSSVGWLGTPEAEVCRQLINGTGQYGTGKRYLDNGTSTGNGGQGTTTNKGGKKIVAIDPGHQGHQNTDTEPNGPGASVMKQKVTSGTSGNYTGLEESVLNLQVSLKLRDELVNRGYEVYMVRESQDVDISNVQRAQMANSSGADIFLRIHANGADSSSTNGALMYQPSSANPYMDSTVISESQRLASTMLDNYISATGLKSLGLLDGDDMTGINWSEIPVTIVEMGFMSNEGDDTFMASESGQAAIVTGLANGVDAYFGFGGSGSPIMDHSSGATHISQRSLK